MLSPAAAQGQAPVVQLAAGGSHSLALRSDGSVVAWGDNNVGQCDVPALPAGLTYVEVAAGSGADGSGDFFLDSPVTRGVSVARRSDGSVVAWGDNSYGQCNVPALPPGMTYTAIDCGPLHSLALRSDGSVVAWGDNTHGQCGVPALPAGLSYVEVAAGGRVDEFLTGFWMITFDVISPGYSVARRSDGSVVAWGDGTHGETDVPALPPGITYVKIAAGCQHAAALRSDGAIVQWGNANVSAPPSLPAGVSFVDLDAGAGHMVARLSDGSVLTWGDNSHGQCGVPALPAGRTYAEVVAGGTAWTTWGPGDLIAPEPVNFGRTIARRSDGVVLAVGTNWMGPMPFSLQPGFLDVGNALPGTHGNPTLRGFGSLLGGSHIRIDLANALPSSLAVLVLGVGIAPTPLLGGTLVPSPDIVVGPLSTDAAGSANWFDTWPAGLPVGFLVAMQYWVVDAGAVQGFAASNAIVVTQY